MNSNKTIKISKDFSTTPGARYITDGDYSGQEFFKTILEPSYLSAIENNYKLIIDLDDTDGYATSFLDEAFGGLARKYGVDEINNILIFISVEEPNLIDEIKNYINNK